MHSILQRIIKKKKQDLIEQKERISLDELKKRIFSLSRDQGKNYGKFLKHIVNAQNIALIAEIKIASPSEGILGLENSILKRVALYEHAGVDAISCISEKHHFKGDITFIPKIREKTVIPILQKDFVIDTYQIYEAKSINSDALLFIARCLETNTLQSFVSLCQNLYIEPILEINNEEDLEKALTTTTNIISVNARDLDTFIVDIDKACALIKKIPRRFTILGFSGI